MYTRTSLLHKLSSREFCPLRTEYSTSRVKTQSYFRHKPIYRCEVKQMRRLSRRTYYYCYHFYSVQRNWFFETIFINLNCKQTIYTKVSRLTISEIIRTAHQNRAWLSLVLYCMQTSSTLTL